MFTPWETSVNHRLALALLGAAACGVALAQVPRPQTAVAVPGPAAIPRASFIETMDGEYKKLDANNDGVVTKVELEASQQRTVAAAAAQRARGIFAKADTDRNGQLSVAEFTRIASAPAQRPDVTQMLTRLDTNRDQKVSLIEYRTITLTGFDKLDTDKDGVVSVAEQRAGGIVK